MAIKNTFSLNVLYNDVGTSGWYLATTKTFYINQPSSTRRYIVGVRGDSNIYPASVQSITLNLRVLSGTNFTADIGIGAVGGVGYPTSFEYSTFTINGADGGYIALTFPITKGLPVNSDFYFALETKIDDTNYNLYLEQQSITITYDENYVPPETEGKTVKYHNGSSWVECEMYYHNGSTWQLVEPYYYTNGTWNEISSGG